MIVAPPGTLWIWTVYQNPSDFPGKFVVRASAILAGRVVMDPEATCVVETLEEARRAIPPGLYRQPRQRLDDPCIVEVWL